jgi:hypothetical protein
MPENEFQKIKKHMTEKELEEYMECTYLLLSAVNRSDILQHYKRAREILTAVVVRLQGPLH